MTTLSDFPRAQRTRHPGLYVTREAPQAWRFVMVDEADQASTFGPPMRSKPDAGRIDYAAERMRLRLEPAARPVMISPEIAAELREACNELHEMAGHPRNDVRTIGHAVRLADRLLNVLA